jgi:hypothetical protein
MLDPATPPGDPPGEPSPDAPAAPPSDVPASEPAWATTYELPTARLVVGAGLQLAATSSGAIRRASLYIGLLALGAFGPAVIFLLFWLGRLMSDPATAEMLTSDPTRLLVERPELVGSFGLAYVLLSVGLLLLLAISIDAQAIAIALLGGVASGQPLRLSEAIVRARQTFWRLLGAGAIVGLGSLFVTIVVGMPFLRSSDSNQGVSFIASMIGALVVTPFAYAATGIVLGDVAATESLRRSWRLFRASPRIAFVVVLFTLLTSAIQTFALGGGAEVAVYVADALDLGLDQGGLALVVPAVLILAFVIAFGSLTFTIAAIVAAPQVAAFLGLTFYTSGLDRARASGGAKPGGFRWVTTPMLASMTGLAVLAVMNLP